MSEHTPLTEAAERGEHFPTTPVQCFCGWRETDPDAGTWTSHLLAARTSTATADTGLRERVEALVTKWVARANALPVTNEQNYARMGMASCIRDLSAVIDGVTKDEALDHACDLLRRLRAILDATAAPTTDTGARYPRDTDSPALDWIDGARDE